ncbi:DUF3888 domain-containing protein [Alkaliphilus hydrothermalis]|uniref:DUF3888 domain-containing protein n=1 Tax=Alkaliphilus hydrothermalis TaxID=1482730 RepID=A0ABS2NLL3_9FIRM|nr:DUF3888 domain-containing protein [Alkaliphilus hydrothermalis]MBM7613797.1 hypothetical protein [Alkaliphilus hydrothermalis]
MTKKTVALSIVITLLITTYLGYAVFNKGDLEESELLLNPPEASTDELYQHVFLTLLDPLISNAIYGYYGESYSHDYWDIKIINLERLSYTENGMFKMTLEVSPYVGAHNSVGVDQITLIIEAGGDVEVVDYKHIKSYDLPPHLQ